MSATERSSPKEVKIEQEIPGSNQAMVKWAFPENYIPSLSHFLICVRRGDNQQEVEKRTIASTVRCHMISKLEPSTNYTVTVVAQYSDTFKTETTQEHLNCGMFHYAYVDTL